MYPNFYAEQRNHHVQENNTMAGPRDGSGGSTRRDGSETATRPPSRNGVLQLKQRVHNGDELSARQTGVSSAERSRRSVPPIAPNRSSNQQEAVTSAPALPDPGMLAPSLRPPSRQVALRGELSLTSPAWGDDPTANAVGISPRLRPLPFPTALSGSARSLLEATSARVPNDESLEDLVINARPRTRYARRELHRQGSAKTLARISTAPTALNGHQSLNGASVTVHRAASLISSHSTGNLLSSDSSRQPPSRQAVQIAVINTVEAALPGTEVDDGTDDDDDTNFFLTELEAEARAASATAAAKLRILARHVTLGSFLLYGNPPALEAAIQHFTAALQSVETSHDEAAPSKSESPARLALTSLLHHHRGVALRELVVASASPTSRAAVASIKHAFAAQRHALKLAQLAQDPRLQARAVKALGLLLLDAHAYGPALTHQQEALQIALEEKDRELEARVYANLGNLALAQLDFGHALSCHNRDLHLCSSKALDCRLGRARAHRNLSIVYAKLHRRDQQLHHEKESRIASHTDGGAYLYDITTHTESSIGNICLQPSTDIDPALVTLVTQNLAEIVRGLAAHTSNLVNVDEDSIIAALEQEWSTADVDLEAALAAVSPESNKQVRASPVQPFGTSTTQSLNSKAGLSRHVSIRIDNYRSSSSLPDPDT
ncbi:hypothetical protein PHYPSEUDO_014949 [Phytophthora pseudosyringae]|uniref:MalT-like TPR region domain-containing protein n=1 Tax=Phytophthora pseudosyringae TaxID=221518 RepID=A0A8T1W0K2_9STRA|nr:hypothetical protein PHYPSEUDO_014949 [Phytophthora pseudosyringae]